MLIPFSTANKVKVKTKLKPNLILLGDGGNPMNKLAKQLIEENIASKNPTLDLGNCGLDGTEPELELLAECEHLETTLMPC